MFCKTKNIPGNMEISLVIILRWRRGKAREDERGKSETKRKEISGEKCRHQLSERDRRVVEKKKKRK